MVQVVAGASRRGSSVQAANRCPAGVGGGEALAEIAGEARWSWIDSHLSTTAHRRGSGPGAGASALQSDLRVQDGPKFVSNAAPNSPATVTTAPSNDHTSAPDVRLLVMISASTQPIPRRASRRRLMKERTSS